MVEQIQVYDVATIGGGPIGMIATYYLGTRGLHPVLIDTQEKFGGQCVTLYPEKMIYDVASQPGCTGEQLIGYLHKQLSNIKYDSLLNTKVDQISKIEDSEGQILWELKRSDGNLLRTKVIVLAIGKGAFTPRKLNVPGENLKGVFYNVQSLESFKGQNVLIVGGGDSAFDWALSLKDQTSSLTQIHRSDQYRAHGISVNKVKEAVSEGQMELLPFHEVKEIRGNSSQEVCEAVIFHNKTKEEKILKVQRVIISAGFLTSLGNLRQWGLHIEHEKIIVDPTRGFLTNLPNIFAIGDIAHFDGKVELITTGFGEAATCAFYAYKAIHGNVKGAAWCAKLPA